MLGLSLSKILLTILIAVVVWKGFALVSRLARERQQQPRTVRQGTQARPRSRRPAHHRAGRVPALRRLRRSARRLPLRAGAGS